MGEGHPCVVRQRHLLDEGGRVKAARPSVSLVGHETGPNVPIFASATGGLVANPEAWKRDRFSRMSHDGVRLI